MNQQRTPVPPRVTASLIALSVALLFFVVLQQIQISGLKSQIASGQKLAVDTMAVANGLSKEVHTRKLVVEERPGGPAVIISVRDGAIPTIAVLGTTDGYPGWLMAADQHEAQLAGFSNYAKSAQETVTLTAAADGSLKVTESSRSRRAMTLTPTTVMSQRENVLTPVIDTRDR